MTLNNKTLINTKYHMFLIINISPNLLQNYRFSLRITQNVLSQKKKKKEKCRHVGNIIMWLHWKLTSLKNVTIFEKKNLTENNNSNNNWKSSKISKSVNYCQFTLTLVEYRLKMLLKRTSCNTPWVFSKEKDSFTKLLQNSKPSKVSNVVSNALTNLLP